MNDGEVPRVLVTGAAGFVGRYTVGKLREAMPSAKVIAAYLRKEAASGSVASEEIAFDIVDEEATRAAISRVQPTHVIHLAAIANSRKADSDRRAAWQINVEGSLNVARAVAGLSHGCRLLSVSSADVYGAASNRDGLTGEEARLEPLSFYGTTKAVAELALAQMAREGLRLIRVRPFNHTGVGQSTDYVVPSLVRQTVAIERGLQPPVLKVGNLAAVCDFLDVRDIVTAYVRVIERFDALPPGTVLNISSGVPVSISDVLQKLLELAELTRHVQVDSEAERRRTDQAPTRVGDPTRARALLDWHPCRSLEETLSWVLEDARLSAAQG